MKTNFVRVLTICLAVIFASFFNNAKAQVDTAKAVQPDTALMAQPDTIVNAKDKKEKKEDDKKRKDEFIAYAGVNLNTLNVSSDVYESDPNLGFHLGFNYKRGKFFYWQVGARFYNSVYTLNKLGTAVDSSDAVGIMGIDIPVTGGINFLSFSNRILALRLFISAVPAINFGVNDNELGLTEDDINSFILYGQGGIGINVAFIVFETGYNFGFNDLLKGDDSKPGQLFVNLGFRF